MQRSVLRWGRVSVEDLREDDTDYRKVRRSTVPGFSNYNRTLRVRDIIPRKTDRAKVGDLNVDADTFY